MSVCCRRRGDFSKCIPIYVVGLVCLIAGIPLMIVGIALRSPYADFLGYVGGASTFFGVMFLFLWHMITIPALERKVRVWDLKVLEATSEELEKSRQRGEIPVFSNPAYERDSSLPGARDASIEKSSRSSSTNEGNALCRANPNENNSNNYEIIDLDESYVPKITTISGSTVTYQSRKGT